MNAAERVTPAGAEQLFIRWSNMKNLISLFITGAFLTGCSSLFQPNMERWQHLFDDQPLVTVAPFPKENQTQFITRNIVLHGYSKNDRWYFVMVVGTIILDHTAVDSSMRFLPMLEFRSVGPETRFSEHRNFQILLNKKFYTYEAIDYTVTQSKGDRIEDWNVGIPRKLMQRLAYSDSAQVIIGDLPIVMNKNMLIPLRTLVDTIQTTNINY